jgi:dTDP-4-dehydrorhamnose 3,5-epimerase
MSDLIELENIKGAFLRKLTRYDDERGSFIENFRNSWFTQVDWSQLQSNTSVSKAGVLRGLHFHRNQVDVWVPKKGILWVALADLRIGSPTEGKTTMLYMGEEEPQALFIPVGVAHGFAAISNSELTYFVNQFHDGSDEHGVQWNDESLELDWAHFEPILSPRDQNNPRLADIPREKLVVYQE